MNRVKPQRFCIVCGDLITHHHKYCDKHYPDKTAKILQYKSTIQNMTKELRKKDRTIASLRANVKELKKELREIKEK